MTAQAQSAVLMLMDYSVTLAKGVNSIKTQLYQMLAEHPLQKAKDQDTETTLKNNIAEVIKLAGIIVKDLHQVCSHLDPARHLEHTP